MNIFDTSTLPQPLTEEHFFDLLKTDKVRIERIVSEGQASPPDFWYDQDQSEWVTILQGHAVVTVKNDDGTTVFHTLNVGDSLLLPAHQKHRVDSTSADSKTIWLVVFF